MRRWQIRDPRFGLALADGHNGVDALVGFLHLRERSEIEAAIKVLRIGENGNVEINYRGQRFYAAPTTVKNA